MIAVGNISMLKPNSSCIPIDRNDDETPVYLDKKYQFFIDVEDHGRLIYTVKPLTLHTETQLIHELGVALDTNIADVNDFLCEDLGEDNFYNKISDLIKRKCRVGVIKDFHINSLIVKYSRCANPSTMLPSLSGIFSAFTVSDISKHDYDRLYHELVATNRFTEPRWFLSKLLYKRKSLHMLRGLSMDEILKLAGDVVNSYTFGMLSNQDLHTKLSVLSNIIRYEREFKKKLQSLFSSEQAKMGIRSINRGLDNLTLLSEGNVDTTKIGQRIPVF